MARRTHGKRPQRIEKTKALIVTEGIVTEPEYLDGLRQEYRSNVSVDIVPFKVEGVGKDPLAVVKKCADLKTKGDYAWAACLVDVDKHANLEEALKQAKAHEIYMVVSNLKFEVWLLWHVSTARRSFSSKELDAEMHKEKLVAGKKGKNLSPSFPYHQHGKASQTALQADKHLAFNRKGPSPSTAMPELIKLLLDSKGQ